jgi:hypothetical protein
MQTIALISLPDDQQERSWILFPRVALKSLSSRFEKLLDKDPKLEKLDIEITKEELELFEAVVYYNHKKFVDQEFEGMISLYDANCPTIENLKGFFLWLELKDVNSVKLSFDWVVKNLVIKIDGMPPFYSKEVETMFENL